jgi:hypothetical protein
MAPPVLVASSSSIGYAREKTKRGNNNGGQENAGERSEGWSTEVAKRAYRLPRFPEPRIPARAFRDTPSSSVASFASDTRLLPRRHPIHRMAIGTRAACRRRVER